MKTRLFILVCLVSVLGFMSCKEEPESITGIWECVDMEFDIQATDPLVTDAIKELMNRKKLLVESYAFIFNPNNTYQRYLTIDLPWVTGTDHRNYPYLIYKDRGLVGFESNRLSINGTSVQYNLAGGQLSMQAKATELFGDYLLDIDLDKCTRLDATMKFERNESYDIGGYMYSYEGAALIFPFKENR